MKTVSKYLAITWFFRKVTLMRMMEYRLDFVFWSAISIMWTIFNFFFFWIIIDLNQNLGGWNKNELFILIATFTILDAFTWSFFYRNFSNYTSAIFSGELDLMMTRPIDVQFLLTTQDNSYTNVFRLLIGILVLCISVPQLDTPATFTAVLMYILLVCTSLVFTYSVWFILSTFAFWIEKLDNINEVFPSIRDLYRVPRTIYSGVFSVIFTTIMPLMLLASVPSEILIGKPQYGWMLFFILITCFFFWLSRQFFLFSLKKYSSAGS